MVIVVKNLYMYEEELRFKSRSEHIYQFWYFCQLNLKLWTNTHIILSLFPAYHSLCCME